MLEVFRTFPYTHPPCTGGCKPSADMSTTPGWTLIGLGALAFVGAIVILLVSNKSQSDPDPETPRPSSHSAAEPVMDAVQRADLARRGSGRAQPAEPDASQDGQRFGGGLAVAGLAGAAVGLLLLGWANSQIDESKKELRQDASLVASQSLDGPAVCRQAAAQTSPFQQAGVTEHCDSSPRSYMYQWGMPPRTVGVLPVEFVQSPGFAKDGQVTVHDKVNDRSLCVTIPDTDVLGQSHPDAFGTTTADVDPYITAGACPNAPVAATTGY